MDWMLKDISNNGAAAARGEDAQAAPLKTFARRNKQQQVWRAKSEGKGRGRSRACA